MKLKLPLGALVRAALAVAAPILAEKAADAIRKAAEKRTQSKKER